MQKWKQLEIKWRRCARNNTYYLGEWRKSKKKVQPTQTLNAFVKSITQTCCCFVLFATAGNVNTHSHMYKFCTIAHPKKSKTMIHIPPTIIIFLFTVAFCTCKIEERKKSRQKYRNYQMESSDLNKKYTSSTFHRITKLTELSMKFFISLKSTNIKIAVQFWT